MSSGLASAIFFESQEGQLCAQHALNMLLQGEYFNAVDLADIANELDEQEKAVLSAQDRENFRSQNMDDTGFFSIQVITVALQRAYDLNLIRVTAINHVDHSAAKAFICNLNEHWFAIRKFGNKWFILNSVKKGPEPVTHSYLSLYFAQLTAEGYSIFEIQGVLPESAADLIAEEEAVIAASLQSHPSDPTMNDEDEELRRALAMSLAESGQSQNPEDEEEDEELKRVLAESVNSDTPGPSSAYRHTFHIPAVSPPSQPEAETQVESANAAMIRNQREQFLSRLEKQSDDNNSM